MSPSCTPSSSSVPYCIKPLSSMRFTQHLDGRSAGEHSSDRNSEAEQDSFDVLQDIGSPQKSPKVLIIVLSVYVVHLQRSIPRNDVERIISTWGKAGSATQAQATYPTSFSRDVVPIPCHSHNDYWRRIPLYDALAAGCTGVEADVWLDDGKLLVGHSRRSLKESRSLQSLYINPLASILSRQNSVAAPSSGMADCTNGIFDMNPNTTLALLIDIKTDGLASLQEVSKSLEPLRLRQCLTHFDGSRLVSRPITVVVTGNAPFSFITSQDNSSRDIFFDAPLDQLWGEDLPTGVPKYQLENSFYASVSMKDAIGAPWLGVLSPAQVNVLRGQIQAAKQRGLKARYWDTPGWPIGLRNHIWDVLQKEGVGMLNVDELTDASKRDWGNHRLL
ncbi:MAG: hypothetical protein Q9222_002545 [Ikaeria aurantiellina]